MSVVSSGQKMRDGESLILCKTHTHNDSPLQSATQTRATHYRREGEGGENAIYTSVGKRGGRKLVSNRILLFFPIYHRGSSSSSSSRRRRTFSICPEVRRVETELFVAKPK